MQPLGVQRAGVPAVEEVRAGSRSPEEMERGREGTYSPMSACGLY